MEISHSYSYGAVAKKAGRNDILSLQAAVEKQPDNMTPAEADEKFITHHYAPGTYARQMFIPAGMCVVGKIHKHAHLNCLIYGRAKVVTEFGEEVLEGPVVWTSEPGTKRAVFALTDLEWLTVHDNPKDLDDPGELEKDIIAPDYETLDRALLGREVKI